MKWEVHHRRCDYCGAEGECRHDMIGIPFYGWGTLEIRGAQEDKDLCPKCMERFRVDVPEQKSELKPITCMRGCCKKEWFIVFENSPGYKGTDHYWNSAKKALVPDIDEATLYTEKEMQSALDEIYHLGLDTTGYESARPQRIGGTYQKTPHVEPELDEDTVIEDSEGRPI